MALGHHRLLCVLVLVVLTKGTTHEKTPRFKACKRNQSAESFNQCLKETMQRAIPELVKGLPEFGVNSIDPLQVSSLDVPRTLDKAAVTADISFRNLEIYGLRNARIKRISLSLDTLSGNGSGVVEGPVYLIGDYRVNGRVLVLPVQGAGKCNITLINIRCEVTEGRAKVVRRKGKDYLTVTNLKFVVSHADRIYIHLENLFNGNKLLGDNMNLVLNENWREIYQDLAEPFQTALATVFRSIINSVARKVPFNTLFP